MKTKGDRGGKVSVRLRLVAQFAFLVSLLLGGGGCAYFEKAALRRSELYFRATSLEKLPPKTENEPVAFLDRVPKGGRVLGVFQFSTERGGDFMMRSVEHNARRVGADAVWVRSQSEGQFPQAHRVPAHWESRPFTRFEQRRYAVQDDPGKPPRIVFDTVPVTGYRTVFVPEQRWTNMIRYHTVDALMLKLR